MIIHFPSLKRTDLEIQAAARIEVAPSKKGLPEHLWFRFPLALETSLSLECDPYVVALLLFAMQRNERIEVRGSISKKLFQGLFQYQDVFHAWYPERFHRVEIVPMSLREDHATGSCEATAFSGGVDSFFTLFHVLKQPRSRLKSLLFMAGFDMPLHLRESIGELTKSYRELAHELGIDFIEGSTNVRGFVNAVDWTNAHGQALAASAMFFKDQWTKFYIPSSYTNECYPKWGTHPKLDGLLSTEGMQFVHQGTESNRVQKLKHLVSHPETYERLRVCWIQDIGLRNCGQCEKCIRTMIALEILGARARYSTFPDAQHPLSNRIRSLKHRTYQSRTFARELVKEALVRRKLGVSWDLTVSLLRREWMRQIQ